MDPTKKGLYTAKRESGVDVSDPAIVDAFSQLKSDAASLKFMVLSLVASTPKTQLVGSGADLSEMQSLLTDDNGFYAVVRASVEGKTKFFHLFFMGTDVGGMKRGKLSMFKSGVFGALEGCHGEISFEGASNVTPTAVVEEIARVCKVSSAGVEV